MHWAGLNNHIIKLQREGGWTRRKERAWIARFLFARRETNKKKLVSRWKKNWWIGNPFMKMINIARLSNDICLFQRKYTMPLLEGTGFMAFKPYSSPMDLGIKLHVSERDPLSNISACKRIIGHIIYLTIVRADIIQFISSVKIHG